MLKYLTVSSLFFASSLAAEPLRVVADIAPLHSLTTQVMGDLGAPELLTPPNASPHGHALRPSEAARLQASDLLIWVGPLMSPWLAEAKSEMAPEAASLALMDAEGTLLLAKRGAHMHDHGHAHEEEKPVKAEGHDHEDHDDHGHDDHAEEGHDHDSHADDEHAHDDHGHDHEAKADAPRMDPHLWLDPENAVIWLSLIAEELARLDPANADTYRSNAATAAAAIEAQATANAARLSALSDLEFLTAHDAYQYFEVRFGLTSHAAVTDSDDQDAGPAHLREVLAGSPGLGCFVIEPSTPKSSITLVTETLNIPAVTIDPLGADLPLGAGHYASLMESLTAGFETCLKP